MPLLGVANVLAKLHDGTIVEGGVLSPHPGMLTECLPPSQDTGGTGQGHDSYAESMPEAHHSTLD